VQGDRRPPGAGAAPPTRWPAPRIDLIPEEDPKRRSAALVGFVAFLLGALVVGGAFGAYALGDRREARALRSSTTSSTTTTTTQASGPAPLLDIRKILGIAQPSVVTIQTGGPTSIYGSAGSGVVISADGLILTNAHVIEGASGQPISVRFNDGSVAAAAIVGSSKSHDIALIKVERSGLTPAKLGSSANLRVGDDVVAIGNSLNLGGDPSVTRGIVSAKDRSINDGTTSLDHLIQTDAAINPGNSGGPLVNAAGEVVGINTAIIQGSQNVGFSIAIDSVQDLITTLKQGGGDPQAKTAVLGIKSTDVTATSPDAATRSQYGITTTSGALVVQVDPPGGAAAAAGITEGDVVVGFNNQPIATSAELTTAVKSHKPGDKVTALVERQGQRRSFQVTLG
jgi:S1-C subfamily serine protease